MEPPLAKIWHIGKDSFDFKNRLDKHFPNGIALSTSGIKLYTKIQHDLLYAAVVYWNEELQNDLPLLRRFNKQLIF